MEISEAARRLKMLREESGLTMRAVAEALDWSLTRYQHYEDRYKRRFLPLELAHRLDQIFTRQGLAMGSVLQLAGIGSPANEGSANPPSPHMAALAPQGKAPRDLPIQGAISADGSGFRFITEEPREFVERPASLHGAGNAFALYAEGDAMEPRYFAGELLYINPNRPISRDCFVAVEFQDGQGLIRQFLQRSDSELRLRQFNPQRDITVPAGQVKRIYRIVGSGEVL